MKSYKWKTLSNRQPLTANPQNIVDILLKNRGIKTKKEREDFLNPKIENVNIKSVEIDQKQVEKTLKRIEAAIERSEKIVIYGDYDVDGVCGTAILWETIYSFYKNVEPYIPHRVDEGYGLSIKGITNILTSSPDTKLIITVDNGIVAEDAVEFAKKQGIDVVITDHHVRSDKLPSAYSIVHTTKLCGTGVAYLLAQEISKKIHNSEFIIQNSLELVALATVADLVPLIGANRALLYEGLKSLRRTNRPGLLELFSESKIKIGDIDTYHIGHIIAPRINASGRITHALDSLRLICTKDPIRARKLALNLGEVNRNRQGFTLESTIHADLEINENEKLIFVHHKDYEQGIIGLIASRLSDKYYKPSIAVSVGNEFSKGSARSVSGFNIIEFIRRFDSQLVNAGGHPMAAGFTIETVRLLEFKQSILEKAREMVTSEHLERILSIDLELNFSDIDMSLFSEISELAPFGMGNYEPIFVSRNVKIENIKPVGRDGKHIKLELSQDNKKIEAIYFNGEEVGLKLGDEIDTAYVIDKNVWNGNESLQLKIKDIKRISLSS